MRILQGVLFGALLGAQLITIEARLVTKRAVDTHNLSNVATKHVSNDSDPTSKDLSVTKYASNTDSQKDLVLDINPKAKYQSIFEMNTFIESNLNYADSGLYAELINNRAFQMSSDAEFKAGNNEEVGSGSLARWLPYGQAKLELVKTNPLSTALPASVVVTYDQQTRSDTSSTEGRFGLRNTGFFGIPVHQGWEYKASFYIRADKPARATIQTGLYTYDGSRAWASTSVDVEISTEWKHINATFTAEKSAPNTNNVFALFLDGKGQAQQIQINLVSVFPPTWKNTVVRKDAAKVFSDFSPRNIRWPGGNFMRGTSFNSRFQWKKTLGDLKDREGRLGFWNAWATDGLGVVEMYNFITELGAGIIVGLWAGTDGMDKAIPMKDMPAVVKEQTDFLHFLLDTNGPFADMRVKYGGPKEPYRVTGAMIGNEGSAATSTPYQDRFQILYDGIKTEFPQEKFDIIATAPVKVPKGEKTHYLDTLNTPRYGTPNDFVNFYNEYDDDKRDGLINYNMEFAVINDGTSKSEDLWGGPGRLTHSILLGSLAEAIFILGMERNGDIVKGAAPAPELASQADSRASQSTPGQLEFDSTRVVKSSSFLIQQGISRWRLDQVHDVVESSNFTDARVYYSAGSNKEGRAIVKLVNYDSVEKSVTIKTGSKSGTAERYQVIGNGPRAANTLQTDHEVWCKTNSLQGHDGSFTVPLPPYSFVVVATK